MRDNVRLICAGGTILSGPEDKAGTERRGQERHTTLLRVALLHAGGVQDICVVKNISSTGLSTRVYTKLAIGESVQIEFRSGELLTGSVVWARDREVGISFRTAIDVNAVLAGRWVTEIGRARNLPRIQVACQGQLRTGSGSRSVLLRDISQAGARLCLETPDAPTGAVVLSLPGLPPVAGVVRWVGGNDLGVSFNEHIAFDLLARWIEARRDKRSQARR
jgi:hypothetical protein